MPQVSFFFLFDNIFLFLCTRVTLWLANVTMSLKCYPGYNDVFQKILSFPGDIVIFGRVLNIIRPPGKHCNATFGHGYDDAIFSSLRLQQTEVHYKQQENC